MVIEGEVFLNGGASLLKRGVYYKKKKIPSSLKWEKILIFCL